MDSNILAQIMQEQAMASSAGSPKSMKNEKTKQKVKPTVVKKSK